MRNLTYKSKALSNFFSGNRIAWDQFYPSERKLLESIKLSHGDNVLDIGCGCGGLGLALNERFNISSYTGVDMHSDAIEAGRRLNPSATFLRGDILDVSDGDLSGRSFDVVCSLSCVDWNLQFSEMLSVAWGHVKPGGKFVSTFRLCLGDGSRELKDSYQYINYEGNKEGEVAAYVVLNPSELMTELKKFDPSEIIATGYWGSPSSTAVTPYDSLCFAAFSISKRTDADLGEINFDLDLPQDVVSLFKK